MAHPGHDRRGIALGPSPIRHAPMAQIVVMGPLPLWWLAVSLR